jgi:hypothetical protein
MQHIEEWLEDRYITCPDDEKYARAFFTIKVAFNAAQSWNVSPIMEQHKLFCTYRSRRYRCTGCSTMGDIWLRKNFTTNIGYDLRVDINECSNFTED